MAQDRQWIRKGDRTTAGGEVTSGLDNMLHMGQPLAFERDAVFCPACDSTGFIQCIGERISFTGPHGREMALEGDLCVCQCFPPPRLVAGQHHASSQGVAGFGARADGGFFAGRTPWRVPDPARQRFLVCGSHDEPLPNRRYRLTYPGGVLEGRTDAQGYTDWVSGRDGADISIEVFGEAA